MNRKHAYLYIIYIYIDMRASADRCRAEFRGAGPDQCRLYPERHHYCRREDGPCDRQQGPVQAITARVPIQGLRGAQEVRGQPRHVWQLAPQVQEANGHESEAGKSPVRFHHRPPGGARGRDHVSVEVRDTESLYRASKNLNGVFWGKWTNLDNRMWYTLHVCRQNEWATIYTRITVL